MSEKIWCWWVSGDEYRYSGPYDSKEQALDCATNNDFWTAYICEATQPTIEDIKIDARVILEQMEEDCCEWSDPDGDPLFSNVTEEQGLQLQKLLIKTFRKWVSDNNINIRFWGFDEIRNEEKIILKDGD